MTTKQAIAVAKLHDLSRRIPCAVYGCSNPALWREVVTVRPNGTRPSLAFYYRCTEHKYGIRR